jgi:ABC-type transport system involved in cytochrome c biogenesis permease subunit
VVQVVTGSAGSAIPGLQADPTTAPVGDAAAAAMIHASKVTTGGAALVIALGLAATWSLPYVAPPERRPRKRRAERGAAA